MVMRFAALVAHEPCHVRESCVAANGRPPNDEVEVWPGPKPDGTEGASAESTSSPSSESSTWWSWLASNRARSRHGGAPVLVSRSRTRPSMSAVLAASHAAVVVGFVSDTTPGADWHGTVAGLTTCVPSELERK